MKTALLLGLWFGATSARAADVKVGEPTVAAAPLDLNKATEDQLVDLPGVGPSKAHAIVEYRGKTPFRKVEDLLKVRGIGRGIFRQIRERVAVRESAGTGTPTAPRK